VSIPPTDDGFDAVLGFELVQADGDRVLGRLPVAPHLHQPYGIVHGGVWCSVVETAASVGGALWFGERGQVVGVSNHTNFLRAVREGVVEVEAVPVHRGRTQQLWQVTCTVSGGDAHGKLVAQGQVRLANITPEAIGG
jgi:1,4-dihydroxy-2-naphthoyl-CoA hydrolase